MGGTHNTAISKHTIHQPPIGQGLYNITRETGPALPTASENMISAFILMLNYIQNNLIHVYLSDTCTPLLPNTERTSDTCLVYPIHRLNMHTYILYPRTLIFIYTVQYRE